MNPLNGTETVTTWMAWLDDEDPEVLDATMEVFATFFLNIGWTTTTEDWTQATIGGAINAVEPSLDATEPRLVEELNEADNAMASGSIPK